MAKDNEVHLSTMQDLIYKYLNKTILPEESEQLRNWIELREENRATFNKLAAFYRNDESKLPVMKEMVWVEINQRLGRGPNPKYTRPLLNWEMIFKVAAVLLIISAIVFRTYQISIDDNRQALKTVSSIIKEAPFGAKITTKLPDGSMVTLNSGSKILFPEEFQGDTREVVLSGEAFFEVEHDQEKPFLVKMKRDVVRVLGTSFNIRSYPEDSAVYVAVASGRVSYSIPSGDEVMLEPGRMATYTPGKRSLETGEVNARQAFGWKDKILYFNNLTFDKISIELERWYGVKISYDKDIELDGTYSEQFHNATLQEVLHSLSFVYRFNFEIQGKKIMIINKAT